MRISSVKYSMMDAAKSFSRNRSLSTASIATVAATLFIMGVFVLITLNINIAIKGIASQLEVKIALKDDISISDQNNLETKLKNISGVVSVSMETKEQALNNFKSQLGDKNKSILEGLESNNPLPNSYIIKVKKPEIISSVVSSVKNMTGIDEIQDGRELVNNVISVTNTIKWVGVVLFIILFSVSLFLIVNTIKLTVYSRRREIGIMKFIGATDWFIRIPFIMEGLIIGVIGAVFSDVILYFVYWFACSKLSGTFAFMQLLNASYVFTNIIWMFIGAGMLIGASGSILAVRKFLSV